MDLSLKEQLWADVLFLLLGSPHEFEKLYQLCPEDIKHLDKVKSTSYTFVIIHNPSAVCIKDLIAFSDRTEDYGVLLQYLKKAEPSIAANIFDEHAYLFKKNSAFLRISLLSAQNMMVEGGTLALAQKTNNSVLVTDDQFLYALASEENQINIGLISFLSVAYKDWETLLDISKRLQRLNFSNYFPLNLYDRIVSSLCEDKANISEGSQKIQKWILSDTDDTPTLHHEDVILRLAKEVYNSGADYLDPGGFLTDCVFQIIKRRSPETAKQLIGDTINALHTYLICEDPPSVSASDCASNSNQPCNSLSSAENTLAT